jgi:phage protein D
MEQILNKGRLMASAAAGRRTLAPTAAGQKQAAARAALEARAGRALTDVEWERGRANLVEFASIVRAWYRQRTSETVALPEAA